jgi:protein involved in polysaccharide export with SLBB domain
MIDRIRNTFIVALVLSVSIVDSVNAQNDNSDMHSFIEELMSKDKTKSNASIESLRTNINDGLEQIKRVESEVPNRNNVTLHDFFVEEKEQSKLEVYYETLLNQEIQFFGNHFYEVKDNKTLALNQLSLYNNFDASYIVGPRDSIKVSVVGLYPTNKEIMVNRVGELLLPGLAPFVVNGLTVNEIREDIEKIIQIDDASARVYVGLDTARLINISVTGAVGTPITISMPAYTPLSLAMGYVGGIESSGSLRKVSVLNNASEPIHVDLYSYLLGKSTFEEIFLKEGDRLHIHDVAGTFAVAGFVGRENIFEMPDGINSISVIEALEYAGISLLPPGSFFEILKINKKGSVVSEKIGLNRTRSLLNGEALRVTFVKTRDREKIDVEGSVVEPYSVAFRSGQTVASVLRNGDALTKNAVKHIALILPQSSNEPIGTLSLFDAFDNPDDYPLRSGDTVVVLSQNNYSEILNADYFDPTDKTASKLSQGDFFRVFIDGKTIALLPKGNGVALERLLKQNIISLPEDIVTDYVLISERKINGRVFSHSLETILKENLDYENGIDLHLLSQNMYSALLKRFSNNRVKVEKTNNTDLVDINDLVDIENVEVTKQIERKSIKDQQGMVSSTLENDQATLVETAMDSSQQEKELYRQDFLWKLMNQTHMSLIYFDSEPYSLVPTNGSVSATRSFKDLLYKREIYPFYSINSFYDKISGKYIEQTASLMGKEFNKLTQKTTGMRNIYYFYSKAYIWEISQNIAVKGYKFNLNDSELNALSENMYQVLGMVNKPGNLPIGGKHTLADALNAAGGLRTDGDSTKVRLREYKVSSNGVIKLFKTQLINISLINPKSITLPMRYDIFVPNLINDAFLGTAEIKGEVRYPGQYSFGRGDTVNDLIERAGGFSKTAYILGASFQRESLKKIQALANAKLSKQLNQAILAGIQNDRTGEGQVKTLMLYSEKLTNLPSTGRQSINLVNSASAETILLEEGDVIFIPARPSHVTVMGAVFNEASLAYHKQRSLKDYLALAGGVSRNADIKNMFVVLPNGETKKINTVSAKSTILPAGSAIIVPPKVDKLSALALSDIIARVMGNIATSILAINTLTK